MKANEKMLKTLEQKGLLLFLQFGCFLAGYIPFREPSNTRGAFYNLPAT